MQCWSQWEPTRASNPLGDQVRCESGKAIVLPFGPTILDADVAMLNKAAVVEALAKCAHDIAELVGRY